MRVEQSGITIMGVGKHKRKNKTCMPPLIRERCETGASSRCRSLVIAQPVSRRSLTSLDLVLLATDVNIGDWSVVIVIVSIIMLTF